jgi:hypothetical protein
MASNMFYQLRDSSPAKPGTHSATERTDLCCALQSLVEDLVGVYLQAEKEHWHLQLHRQEEGRLAGADALAHVTQDLCASALSAILQLGCSMQNHSSVEEEVHFVQFINAVAALHASTQTLPRKPRNGYRGRAARRSEGPPRVGGRSLAGRA